MSAITAELTFKEVQAAQAAFEHAGGSSYDPAGPLFQWSSLRQLEQLRELFEAGCQPALFMAIRRCANHDLVMPEWVARAYIRAYDRVLNCEVKTWDEAFGSPFPKHAQLHALRERREKSTRVHIEITRAKRQGRAITDELFEEVAAQMGLGLTRTKEYYYYARRRAEDALNAPGVKDLLDEFRLNEDDPKSSR